VSGNLSNLEKEGRPGEKTIEGFISTFVQKLWVDPKRQALTPY
jgi:hypothetical protein